MRQIKLLQPDSQFVGIGGERMISEGLQSLALMSEVAVVGFWEVAKKYAYFKKLLSTCIDILKNDQITAFIPVDYPGFNIRLAKQAKLLNIPVYYYIAPQLWAWGKNRATSLAKVCDKLLVVFPFEVEYFQDFGIETVFVGHPLLDNPHFSATFKSLSERNGKIAFFPGSRQQEIQKHLKLFEGILEYNQKAKYNFEFIVAKSSNVPQSAFSEISKNRNVEISENSIDVMNNSTAGIIKTGTSNLEAALSGMPFSMFYKTSFLTFKIAERLINLPYISIVNILSNRMLVNEFIQNQANPKLILDSINNLYSNEKEYSIIQNSFIEIKSILGGSGASKRAAEVITKSS